VLSQHSYAKGIRSSFDLYLGLPPYAEYTVDGDKVWGLTNSGLQHAFKIHATYQSLGRTAVKLEDEVDELTAKCSSYERELSACKFALTEVDLSRREMYNLYEITVKDSEKKLKKQKIKFIGLGVSGGVVALVGGFLIGWLVGR